MKITLLKEKSFAILMSIMDLGESGTKKDVLDNISRKGYFNFDSTDLEVKKNRNELHWRNDLAFIRKKLVIDGYINDSEKNNWKITQAGKYHLVQLCEEISMLEVIKLKKLSGFAVEKTKIFLEYFKSREEHDTFMNTPLTETEKEQLMKIRIGQGVFKNKLLCNDRKCKICGLLNQSLLIASHIKPWKYSDNMERLDANNGFLLCPNHDSLFDKGYVTFNNEGKILISEQLPMSDYELLNINSNITININDENRKYLEWHRENIFKSKS